MNENKILVISEAIYDSNQSLTETDIEDCKIKVENDWYFLKEKETSEHISDVVDRLNKKGNFRLILIHRGIEDKYLNSLRNGLPHIACKIGGFHTIGDEIKDRIEKYDTDYVIEYYEKKRLNDLKSQILQLFLPIDIDMQALKTTENAEAYLNDMYAGLEELYKLEKDNERNKNEHYRQKLYDLWYLLDPTKGNKERASAEAKKLTPISNPSDDLRKLVRLDSGKPEKSPIYQFLESLDKQKKDGNDLKEEVDFLLAPFKSSGLKIGGNEIKSFHDWYCALASCLRGEEACK